MKRIKIKWIVIVAIFLSLSSGSSFATQVGNIAPINANFGGIINNHDMMMLKEKQRLYEEKRDFSDFQDKKNNKKPKESVIQNGTQNDSDSSEKIYNEETSNKIKEEQASFETSKKQKNSFFKRKKNTASAEIKEPEDDKKKIIEKTDTTTTIKAGAEKTAQESGKVFIKAVGVTNSKILSDAEIQSLTDSVIGKYVSFEDLEKLVQSFNFIYATKGYVTARAFLPPQEVDNGVVRINLIEGSVGNVNVENNKWTADSYVKKRVSAKSGDLFQIVELEKDILKFNKYNDGVKLKANLVKGEKIGTTDINLVAEERFPFHVVGLMDNAGRKTIGELRGGVMAYADSLFKQRDRLSVGAYASRYSVTPFADYNIPVNKYDGRVGFMFSSSNAKIGNGDYKIFDIQSRSYNYALYYTHPLIRKNNFELNSYTAINYKQASTAFSGFTLYTDKVTSFETALNARLDTKKGIWYVNQGVYQAFPIISEESKYFKYTGSVIRLHDFGHGVVGQFRGMYQYSPQDVIPYIDQFQAGGLATIRGYSEGLLIGKSGYILSGELLFPLAPQSIKIKPKKDTQAKEKVIPFLGKYVKGIAFVDHSGIYPFKGQGPGTPTYNANDYLVSMGFGLRITLPGDATARLYWGCPLLQNSHEQYKRNPRFSFEISVAPDFDRILKYRKTLKNKETL